MNDFGPIPTEIPFPEVLAALLDTDKPLLPRFLYRFSDLESDEIQNLESIWGQIPTWRRKALLEDLEALFGDDYLLSFEAVCRLGLQDQESEIRFLAIRSLLEYDVDDLIPTFLALLKNDAHQDVQAAAATALGKYVYKGAVEELAPKTLRNIEERLLEVIQGSDEPLVRRRALESLGYSSRKELPALIESAFNTQESDWIASALFAMGRSCDQRWQEHVIQMLDHVLPAIRAEAARAAGEIEILEAIDHLLELLDDDNQDVRMAATWSLSQIGGENVQESLTMLLDATENTEEAEFIETAIDNLVFNQGVQFYGIIDFPKGEDGFESDFDDDDYDEYMEEDFND